MKKLHHRSNFPSLEQPMGGHLLAYLFSGLNLLLLMCTIIYSTFAQSFSIISVTFLLEMFNLNLIMRK